MAIIDYNSEEWISEYRKNGEQVKILYEYDTIF